MIAWLGCGMLPINQRTKPKSSSAYCSKNDLQSLMCVKDPCTESLTKAKQIDDGSTQGSSTGTTLVVWLNAIQRQMVKTGTDSVAYVLKSNGVVGTIPALRTPNLDTICNEVCLFTDWGPSHKSLLIKSKIKSRPSYWMVALLICQITSTTLPSFQEVLVQTWSNVWTMNFHLTPLVLNTSTSLLWNSKFENLLLTNRWPPLFTNSKTGGATGFVVQLKKMQKSMDNLNTKVAKFEKGKGKQGDHS